MKYLVGSIALLSVLVCIAAVVSALKTGRVHWKPSFVERRNNPATFWLAVVTYGGMAVSSFLLGLIVLLFR